MIYQNKFEEEKQKQLISQILQLIGYLTPESCQLLSTHLLSNRFLSKYLKKYKKSNNQKKQKKHLTPEVKTKRLNIVLESIENNILESTENNSSIELDLGSIKQRKKQQDDNLF